MNTLEGRVVVTGGSRIDGGLGDAFAEAGAAVVPVKTAWTADSSVTSQA